MSGIALGLTALEAVGLTALQAIVSTSPRRELLWNATDQTGTQIVDPQTKQPVQSALFPQVSIEEAGIDEMRITQHPVEQGAAITDHAYKLPATVQLRAGWSYAASSPGISLGALGRIGSPIPVPTDPSFLRNIYNTLLQVQLRRSIVTLVTGKRIYQNMLLQSLRQTTDERTENVLVITAIFQEILFARTQVVTVPDASVMQNPAQNAATTDQGTVSLQSGANANVPSAQTALDSSGIRSTPLGLITQ